MNRQLKENEMILRKMMKDFKNAKTEVEREAIRGGALRLVDESKRLIEGGFNLANERTQSIQSAIDKYGDWTIFKMRICRIPLDSKIEKLANIMTLGKFEKAKHKESVDQFYHLFNEMAVRSPEGKVNVVLVEKNQSVRVIDNRPGGLRNKKTEAKNVNLNGKKLTFREFFENAEGYSKQTGEPPCGLWRYDSVDCNCQNFQVVCLKANRLLTPELERWISQPVEKIVPGYIKFITRQVTNLAAGLDVLREKMGFKL